MANRAGAPAAARPNGAPALEQGPGADGASPSGAPPRRKLIMGLGNPGPEYQRHRHNVGFQCLDCFARQAGIKFEEGHKMARLGEGEVDGVPVVLAKPKTYVNKSGDAAAALLQRYRLLPSDLIVVYDELDLPLGKIRVREQGSAGGHNGMRSIIDRIGTQQFARIRVGIGRPPDWSQDVKGQAKEEMIVRWVLSSFRPDEEQTIVAVRERVSAALRYLLKNGVAPAMNYFNTDKNFV